jgi:hypothetical protein
MAAELVVGNVGATHHFTAGRSIDHDPTEHGKVLRLLGLVVTVPPSIDKESGWVAGRAENRPLLERASDIAMLAGSLGLDLSGGVTIEENVPPEEVGAYMDEPAMKKFLIYRDPNM